MTEQQSDQSILTRIHDLVDEEHRLRTGPLTHEQRLRLQHIEEHLDQCWDLLRQRRAREESGDDPALAKQRAVDDVEGYLQ